MLAFVFTILVMTASAPPASEPSWSWLENGKPLQLNRYNQTTQHATEADETVASRTTLTSPARLRVPWLWGSVSTLHPLLEPTRCFSSNNPPQRTRLRQYSAAPTRVDKTIAVPHGSSKVVLHTFSGSSQSSMDFMPGQQVMSPGDPVSFTPVGGRSSNGVLPYFGVEIVTALPSSAAASNGVVFSKF